MVPKYVPMTVELLAAYGGDIDVVNAARVSFAKSVEAMGNKDRRLIQYLAKHDHWTPFGHIFASFRIKAPIFVARQLGKHQVGLVWNEESRRYVDHEPEFYEPELRLRAENVKQGSSEEVLECPGLVSPATAVFHCLEAYNEMLSQGVAPEVARAVLPQNTMTSWIWSGSVVAFSRVCKLRLDPHTQKETRLVAKEIDKALRVAYPESWKALMGEFDNA